MSADIFENMSVEELTIPGLKPRDSCELGLLGS